MKGAILWKRILNEGLGVKGDGDQEVNAELAKRIITAPIIVSCLRHDFDDGFRTAGLAKAEDYSDIAMPFNSFWLEGTTESSKFPNGNVPWGALVQRVAERRYELSAIRVAFSGDNKTISRPIFFGLHVFDLCDGTLVLPGPGTNYFTFGRLAYKICGGPDNGGEMRCSGIITAVLDLTFETLQLLSCNNVSLSPRDNEPKEMRRAAKRHGGKPEDYRYHTLIVRPAGSKPGTPGREIDIMSEHTCRGCYARYGDAYGKGKLFGKYSGKFYHPPSVKGNPKNGVVVKDYVVPPPDQPPGATEQGPA